MAPKLSRISVISGWFGANVSIVKLYFAEASPVFPEKSIAAALKEYWPSGIKKIGVKLQLPSWSA
uniref:hypothetical protein n=1 Tax=Pseudomonas sp. TH49 TaxID=2796413 RepID=UPI001F5B4071|nr:hypothetical protein [Pseudomonas sp. TH49]